MNAVDKGLIRPGDRKPSRRARQTMFVVAQEGRKNRQQSLLNDAASESVPRQPPVAAEFAAKRIQLRRNLRRRARRSDTARIVRRGPTGNLI